MGQWIFTLQELPSVAPAFWKSVHQEKVFAFHGQMGSGKTTVIHALCDALRVTSTVGSPTFSIINEYGYAGGTIFHIDLYRLANEEEAIRAGVEEALYSGSICLVEWPELIPHLFPDDTMHIYIDVINDLERRIRVEDK